MAILELHPKITGHMLVISTRQLDDITELDPDSDYAAKL
jgi:diadenosine tetraphosphate (Ap4A) HIT family hydrolase